MKINQQDVDLSTPIVMGILNVTPDSFSDGGKHQALEDAVAQANQMILAGATFIDIGGESTRPGAPDVSESDELARVIPVIKAIRSQSDVWISIDTSKANVMRGAIDAGANMINDVRALQEPGALQAAVDTKVPICIMHMQGQPRSMQQQPAYKDVCEEVMSFLLSRADDCVEAGVEKSQIILDPGFGFGKSLAHNYKLLENIDKLVATGYPVLAGMSRKSMIGAVTGRDVNDRLAGSLAVATIAAMKGAQIIRVHDVAQTVDAVKIVSQLKQQK